jgi:hypothetical protein
MKRPDEPLIEAWLDGRLEGRAALDFQERLSVDPQLAAELELAEQIQSSLRRSFVPPAVATPELVAASVPVAGVPWRRVAGVLAAAAVVVLVLRVTGVPSSIGGRVATPERPGPLPSEEPLRRVAAVGPLAEQDSPDVGVSAPDLDLLYAETLADAGETSLTCGPEDDLGATLAAAYGERVTVSPEASQMLHGPYGSSRWPTGSIYTGSGANPSVLVAERDATHRCCVLFELSEQSELNLFTWQLGDLVLTEITPESEPSLLGFFE